MPTKPKPRITAWSYSRLNDYQQCPLRAKLKYVDRLKEPGSAAMDRGGLIHESAAAYIRGELRCLPKDLSLFRKEFKVLRELNKVTPLAIESQWAFTSKWSVCDWFGKEAWCRMVIDLATPPVMDVLSIVDYKTGRNRFADQRPQLELYAIGGFLRYPKAKVVHPEFWYTDQGEVEEDEFHRKDLEKLLAKWAKATKPMLSDKTFAPRPSGSCRWCHFSAAKAGPCKF